jgi:hypothetical protein
VSDVEDHEELVNALVNGIENFNTSNNTSELRLLVGMTGFEPAASSSRTKRATGLRYIPKLIPRMYYLMVKRKNFRRAFLKKSYAF